MIKTGSSSIVKYNIHVKNQIVSSCPDVVNRTVDKEWEFLLLACDGIWDVLSNQVRMINIYNLKLCFLKEKCRKKRIITF